MGKELLTEVENDDVRQEIKERELSKMGVKQAEEEEEESS